VKVAIVGSRKYPALHVVRSYVSKLKVYEPRAVIISGNASGVDKTAQDEALKLAMRVYIIPADWRLGKGAGFARNEEIVNEADVVVAFWDGSSRGTAHDIGLAKKANKRLRVFGPEGQLLEDVHPIK
jgi:hypothetical protein